MVMLSLSLQCHVRSPPPPPSAWWAGLWRRAGLVDCLQVDTSSVMFCEWLQIRLTTWHLIAPLICCLSARFHPEVDQSGSSLRHHDQQLWVRKNLFPQTQRGEDTQATAGHERLIYSPSFLCKPTRTTARVYLWRGGEYKCKWTKLWTTFGVRRFILNYLN